MLFLLLTVVLSVGIFSTVIYHDGINVYAKTKKTLVIIYDEDHKKISDLDSKSLTKKLSKMSGENVTIYIKYPGKDEVLVGIYKVLSNNPPPPPPPPPVNTPPVAISQSITTEINKTVTFTLKATDKENNPLTYTILNNTENGGLAIGDLPVIKYLPNVNFTGSDKLTWKANDGKNDSNIAIVSITVTNTTIPPPPPPPNNTDTDIALINIGNTLTGNFNQSKIYRLCAVGDVDSSQSGQQQQIALFKTLNCDWAVVIGDFAYSGQSAGNTLLSYITNNGFKGNATIVTGNHDIFGNDCPNVKDYMNTNVCYSRANDVNGYLFIVGMDANNIDSFASGSTQYNFVKNQLESSDGHFNVVAIHQPFVTAKSNHANNGQFGTYQSIFKNNGVKLVLEAHNHNFQHFEIDGVTYLLVGTGRHDSGNNMYPINSNNDGQGHDLIKGITGKNGIGVIDFMFHSATVGKDLNGYFVDDTGKILYNFIS